MSVSTTSSIAGEATTLAVQRYPVIDFPLCIDELPPPTTRYRLILRAAPRLGARTRHGFVAIAQKSFDPSTICACAKPAAASNSATPSFG